MPARSTKKTKTSTTAKTAKKRKPSKKATRKAVPALTQSPQLDSQYSFASFLNFVSNNFTLLLVAGLIFIGGFFVGSVWTENQLLKGDVTSGSKPLPVADSVPTGPEGPTPEQLAQMPEVTKKDHIRGNRKAKVVLVEYSDFECPFCNTFHPTMQQVMEEYGDDVGWVFRHYPLAFHPHAQKAAEASECVAKLEGNEAFWEFGDILFAEASVDPLNISLDKLPELASRVGVNAGAVESCLDSDEMAEVVREQANAGGAAGVQGTPATILVTKDGQHVMISGAQTFDQVKATIDQYL